ncbi:MAG: hypothetical protein CMJ83_03580 [Planctomycetes bacterium]|nr:hypothetical protein [Planctomycetota bacterium]
MGCLDGKHALVTGGTSGIGCATARVLAGEGCRVTVCGRDPVRLEGAVTDLRASGAVEGSVADVCDEASMVRTVAAASGPDGLDIVVANAGIDPMVAFGAADVSAWRSLLETNVLGAAVTIRAALRQMEPEGRGQVVAISSLVTREGDGSNPVYAGTKHALEAIVDGLRRTSRGNGVRFTTIRPGVVATDMARSHPQERLDALARDLGLDPSAIGVLHGERLPPEMHAAIRALHGRILLPEDVANAVLYAVTQPPGVQIDDLSIRAVADL